MRPFDLDRVPFQEIPLDIPILSVLFPRANKESYFRENAQATEMSDMLVKRLIAQLKNVIEQQHAKGEEEDDFLNVS